MTSRKSTRAPAVVAETAAVALLCPACGLCCNGVLFADVKLQQGDDAERLAKLGLPLMRKGKSRCFSQPCAAFDGKLCRVYADRPARCRDFECRLLQRVQSGERRPTSALRTIAQARRQADIVRKLLQQLGQRDEHLPLTRRYAQVMAEPDDLAGDVKVTRLRSDLMLAMARLMQRLERDFLA